MRKSNKVIAIACADIHLSAVAPAARAGEPDWFAAMARPLDQLWELAREHKAPVLCAGDVFHHWRSPPELINFALDHLPKFYAIPGQHDLPYHSHEQIKKSAYTTLAHAGRLMDVSAPTTFVIEGMGLNGFGWEQAVLPPTTAVSTNICLHHAYRYTAGHAHVNAPPAAALNTVEYVGYGTVIIGDNHISWDLKGYVGKQPIHIFNCGSLMRRHSDQVTHRPRVGLVLADGSVVSHYLDCSADVIDSTAVLAPKDAADLETLKRAGLGVGAVAALQAEIDKLDEPEHQHTDFFEALSLVLMHDALRPGARKVIREAIEHVRADLRPGAIGSVPKPVK